MHRVLPLLFGLLLVAGVIVVGASGLAAPPSGSVYTVAQLDVALRHNPGTWIGRTVLLRATAYPMAGTSCPMTQPWCSDVQLTDGAAGAGSGIALVAIQGPTNPVWTFLRTLPFAARLLPARQMAWGHPALYHVDFVRQTFTLCTPPCLQARLLNQ